MMVTKSDRDLHSISLKMVVWIEDDSIENIFPAQQYFFLDYMSVVAWDYNTISVECIAFDAFAPLYLHLNGEIYLKKKPAMYYW